MPKMRDLTVEQAVAYIEKRITRIGQCWIWPSDTSSARMMVAGRKLYVRKVAKEIWGEPGATEVETYGTTCGHKNCINPAHARRKGDNDGRRSEWHISDEEKDRRLRVIRESGFIDDHGIRHAPWSLAKKRKRSGGMDTPYTVPLVRFGDYMDRVPVNQKGMDRQLRKLAKATEWVCEPGE